MSKAGAILQCGWAFNNPKVPRTTATGPMLYGTGFHSLMEHSLALGLSPKLSLAKLPKIAEEFGLDENELRQHSTAAYERLVGWLGGDNAYGLKLLSPPKDAVFVERAVAYDFSTRQARFCAVVDEHHVYPDVSATEHPGTMDLGINLIKYKTRVPPRFRKSVLVLDHKTGMSCDPPRESHQLKSLALALCQICGADDAILAINHAPRDGLPEIYADVVTADELMTHGAKMAVAFARLGDGSLRPHSGCDWCPGLSVCPAHGGSLGAVAAELIPAAGIVQGAKRAARGPAPKLDLDSPEGLGEAHMIKQMLDKTAEALSDQIKQRVRDGAVGVRPDGKLVSLVLTSRRNLSVASIERAKKAGRMSGKDFEAVMKVLNDSGAIETQEREELRAVEDR